MKRTLDVTIAAAAIVLFSPIMLATAIATVLTQGRPILFRQQRPGLHGQAFTIVKFRTMRATQPGEIWYRTDERRVTRLGRFLRSTSIDELPELWNVIRGDMSLVGPRPLLMDYLESYTPAQRRRHEVRPGITSWAIVNGRHALSFADRLALDTWYVDHWSLRLDLRIMLLTARQVLRRTDVKATQDVDAIGFPLPRPEGDQPTGEERTPRSEPGGSSSSD